MGENKTATDFALLAPVPLVHLESAKNHKLVAFATKNKKLFEKLDGLRKNTMPVDVYIYASGDGGGNVSYGARYVELVPDKSKVLECHYRPESTESDTDQSGEVYWVVEGLHKLTSAIEITAFSGYDNKNNKAYEPSFSPRGPLIVRLAS